MEAIGHLPARVNRVVGVHARGWALTEREVGVRIGSEASRLLISGRFCVLQHVANTLCTEHSGTNLLFKLLLLLAGLVDNLTQDIIWDDKLLYNVVITPGIKKEAV
jgi:hypothetical protein